MGEVDPVAVDRDNAFALGDFEQIDQLIVISDGRPRYHLDRRHCHARRRQQRLVHVGVEAAEAAADDIVEGAR